VQIRTVGVVGAGIMGVGVAQSLAMSSYRVLLQDVSDKNLQNAERSLKNNLRLHSLLSKETNSTSIAEVARNISLVTQYEPFQSADFIIECVTEKWEVKKPLYTYLDTICTDHCIFASNTSAIPITRLGSATKRASKVIGMHFMNPAPLTSTVEVIRGYHTSDETVKSATDLLANIGKKWVIVNDSPGFVSNRVLMLTINEAIFLLHEGVASAEQVDAIFKSCFGHRMGPLETADLIGLDTILLSIEVLHESFGDDKYRPCPLLRKMVDAGLCGRKSGQGFYCYS